MPLDLASLPMPASAASGVRLGASFGATSDGSGDATGFSDLLALLGAVGPAVPDADADASAQIESQVDPQVDPQASAQANPQVSPVAGSQIAGGTDAAGVQVAQAAPSARTMFMTSLLTPSPVTVEAAMDQTSLADSLNSETTASEGPVAAAPTVASMMTPPPTEPASPADVLATVKIVTDTSSPLTSDPAPLAQNAEAQMTSPSATGAPKAAFALFAAPPAAAAARSGESAMFTLGAAAKATEKSGDASDDKSDAKSGGSTSSSSDDAGTQTEVLAEMAAMLAPVAPRVAASAPSAVIRSGSDAPTSSAGLTPPPAFQPQTAPSASAPASGSISDTPAATPAFAALIAKPADNKALQPSSVGAATAGTDSSRRTSTAPHAVSAFSVKQVEDRAQTYSQAAPASPQPFVTMQARSEPQNKEATPVQPVVKDTGGDQTGALASGADEGATSQTAPQTASQTAPQTASSGQAALASAPATTLPTASAAPAASQMSQVAVQTLSDLSLQIQHRVAAGQSQFRIQLTPDSVGKVDVALSIGRDGQTRAQLSFDNPQSAASFAGRLNELGDQLRQAGLDVAPDALSIKSNDATLNGKADDLAAGLSLASDATPTGAQSMSQAPSQPTSQGGAQAATQTATQAAATTTHPAIATSSQGDSPNANANLSQNLAQNFHQGGQSQSHPQQAARRLRNASRLGAIESDSSLDANLDAALSSLRNGQSSSRLALNLIV